MQECKGIRPELGPMPRRFAGRPIHRGYPVPWFVQWLTPAGESTDDERAPNYPEFRCMSPRKWLRAVVESRCWVCGDILGARVAFVLGPVSALSRTSSEPPAHRECAIWSATNCPFLVRPEMVRRDHQKFVAANGGASIAGHALLANPGIALVWLTRGYAVFGDGRGGRLIEVGNADAILWYREGQLAKRADVADVLTAAIPKVLAFAHDAAAEVEVMRRAREVRQFIPHE